MPSKLINGIRVDANTNRVLENSSLTKRRQLGLNVGDVFTGDTLFNRPQQVNQPGGSISANDVLSTPTGPTPIDPVSTTISIDDVGQRPLEAPPAPRRTQDDILDTISSIAESQTPEEIEAERRLRQTEDRLVSLNQDVVDRSREEASLQEQLGVSDFEQEIADINSEIRLKRASLSQGLVDQEGRPIAQEFITGRQAQMRRQAATEIEGLSAASEAAKNNILAAESRIERALQRKYGDLETQIQIARDAIAINESRFTRAEKVAARKREAELAIEQDRLNTLKEREKEAMTVIAQATSRGILSASEAASLSKSVLNGSITPEQASAQANAALGVLSAEERELDLAGKRIANRTALVALANAGDAKSIRQLGFDPRTIGDGVTGGEDIVKAVQTDEQLQRDLEELKSLSENEEAINLSAGVLRGGFLTSLEAGIGFFPGRVVKEDFLNSIKRLTGEYTLNNLIAKKAEGATFGALSNAELGIISASASKLNSLLEIDPDSGEIKGITGSEDALRDALQDFRQKVLDAKDKNNIRMGLSQEEIIEIDSIR